jgi:hypothetical protein
MGKTHPDVQWKLWRTIRKAIALGRQWRVGGLAAGFESAHQSHPLSIPCCYAPQAEHFGFACLEIRLVWLAQRICGICSPCLSKVKPIATSKSEPAETAEGRESSKSTADVKCAKCGTLNSYRRNACKQCEAHLWVVCHHCGSRNPRVSSRCSECFGRLHRSLWRKFSKAFFPDRGKLKPLHIVLLIIAVLAAYKVIVHLAESGGSSEEPSASLSNGSFAQHGISLSPGGVGSGVVQVIM